MSDLAAWLQTQGFGQYAELFASNAIDREALVELTDEHLKELGLPLGHRVKLLKAIRELREPEAAPAAERPTRSTARAPEAERRQLTVMFVDLVGSTALSARLDPEDMSRVIRAYQECCTEVVERWGGHVAKYMGDGVLAYFGWPQAHEDEAERAVRAGLELVEAVGALDVPGLALGGGREERQPLAARIGIATGLVMVGELIGEGAAKEQTVVGETPNLAARLQALAAPGTVVVAPATRRLLGGVFELADLGEHALRGFATPVRVWNVLGEGSSESRFEAARGRQSTPLVGRDDEMEILARRWKCGSDGEGQVVLITGEAGIGKSRLCATLRMRLADQPHTRLTYQCSPHHTDVAFHPVIRQLERAAGIRPEDNRDARLDRLEALLGASSDSLAENIPILAALLSIPTTGRYPAAELDPQQLKERTYRMLVHSLASLTTRQPVLVVFEDLHWADPSTLELLDRLVERAESLPVLVLITARPGFSAPWADQAHVTRLALSRMSRRDSRTLLGALVGPGSLPERAVDDITTKSDGIPLFVEELTRAVLEARARGMSDATGSERIEVPASLQDSLTARLDRLTAGKAVAQMAAAIGREFGREMLEPICGLSRRDLDQALDALLVAGLLNRRGTAPNASYVFKHALVQDAAYNSLLRANRRKVHRRIAEALGDRLADQPAVLAHHWECAEEFDQALQYRLAAGERAAKQYAMWEAIAQYWRALRLLQQLPETNATRRQYVETVVALIGTGLIFWQSEAEGAQALQHIDKALEIATESQALAHLARLEAFKGNYWHDESYFSQAVRHTAMVGDGRLSAEVARRYASYLGRVGQFEASHVHSERAIELYAGLGAGAEQGLAMAVEGRCYFTRAGNIERALHFARRAAEIAEATGDPRLKAWLAMESEPYMYQGLWERTVQVVERNLPFAWEIGNWGVILFSSAWATIAYIKLARLGEARALIQQAMTIAARRTAYEHHQIYPEIALNQLHLASGDTEAALAAGQRALALAVRAKHRMEEGAAHRVLGQAHQAKGSREEAEGHFRRSLDILGAIQSRPELAQSLLAYGRFKLADDADEGRRVLRAALTTFEDMDAPGWAMETRAALDA